MPKRRVFVDSSVLIRGLIYEESNSSLILDLIARGEVIGVINPRVIDETMRVLKSLVDKDFASLCFSFIHSTFEVIPRKRYEGEIKALQGKIKEKDLEHLATVRALGLKFLLAYDRDFDGTAEYMTPKQFVKSMGLKQYDTPF